MADELSAILSQLGNFATSPQMPVLSGQLAAAAMGPNQNSWQANVGRVASGYGQSAIAAKEAQAQGAKTQQMNAWLKQILPNIMAGAPMTAEGVQGPTKQKVEINPDGTYKHVVEGNAATIGNNEPAGGGVAQAPAPAPAAQAPTQAPGQRMDPRMLPFLMALSGNSSGGANTNLTGLSPEDISKSVAGNVAGGKLAQDSIQNIFENSQKMAYSDYLDRLPQAHAPKVEKAFADKFENPTYNKDTGTIWVINQLDGKAVDTGIKPDNELLQKLKQGGAGAAPYAPVIVIGADGQPTVQGFNKRTGTVPPPQPGVVPPVSAEAARKQGVEVAKEDKRVAELDTTIQGLKIDKDSKDRKKFVASTQSHLDEFNEKATSPYVYVMDEVTDKGIAGTGIMAKTEIKPVQRALPPGMDAATATKAYKVFLKNGRTGTFDNFVYELQQGTIKIK
jgi:hypothetical protein